jgi:hypothetical protein
VTTEITPILPTLASLTAEQHTAIAQLIGDAKPATGRLVEQLAETVRDRREHDHTTQREDWFCMNLTSWMGERMGPVLRRLLDAEARAAELETDLAAKAQDAEAAMKGWERARDRVTELEVAAVEGRAALAALCHDLDDPGSMALGALYLLQQATPGTPMEPGETVPKVYRASHDSIVMGLYTTAAAAREHCEADMRRDLPSVSLDWIEDEEDGVAELVAAIGEEERSTGFVVTALEVASKYDEEADE